MSVSKMREVMQRGLWKTDAVRDYTETGIFPYSALKDLQDRDLYVRSISMQSPLEICVAGALCALVLAVIISGGEVDLRNLKFKMPSIGHGIREIRSALGLDQSEIRHKERREPPPKDP
jgi:hypothetical protein